MTSRPASATTVVETAPLWVVADMVKAGQFDAVLVVTEAQELLGMVRADAVLRVAPRLPEAPVRLLPLQKVARIEAWANAPEVLAKDDEVEGVALGIGGFWSVMFREHTVEASA
ncbi:MAG: hypothetical protein ACOZQL_22300 [Myxococcota bacterium]